MNLTYVDEKSLKTLEDLSIVLVTGLLSLQTLHNLQVKAVQIGIMSEEMNTRANTIAWDLRRLIKQYNDQLEDTLEQLPEGFTLDNRIEALRNQEVKKAKQLISKSKKNG